INSAKQWADAHPNITATAQTALAVAEAAGTVWGGKKVELNPAKWDWVKNNGYKTPAARPMQTLDGEMAGGNKSPKSNTSTLLTEFNQNDINHVFQEKHEFDSFLKNYTSKADAYSAIQNVANNTLDSSTYQKGTWVTIQVDGVPVSVKGNFVDGKFRIGTATMKSF
ncbi:MafB family polymorphic toxin, partial [Neisseria gonorrhoeae]